MHVRAEVPATAWRSPEECCPDDDCPQLEASALWPRAQRLFGHRARELTFLSGQAVARAQ